MRLRVLLFLAYVRAMIWWLDALGRDIGPSTPVNSADRLMLGAAALEAAAYRLKRTLVMRGL